MKEVESGYRVMLGGKLGRHPRLAAVILKMADEKQLWASLEAAIKFFMENSRNRERWPAVLALFYRWPYLT
ncbi:hypothetical protein [Neomoorella thermoacetica]|uniref:hypothetical protein n=1 Tax=Neomoorella thermoacetica TaxID=1525 RepID=UPI003BF58EDC